MTNLHKLCLITLFTAISRQQTIQKLTFISFTVFGSANFERRDTLFKFDFLPDTIGINHRAGLPHMNNYLKTEIKGVREIIPRAT